MFFHVSHYLFLAENIDLSYSVSLHQIKRALMVKHEIRAEDRLSENSSFIPIMEQTIDH